MKKVQNVQYLRGLAAASVIAFHAAARVGGEFGVGAGGVDIFFIISGFIMWTITQDRPLSPIGFLTERARRIIPLYWLATCVMSVGAVAGLFPNMVVTPWHFTASLFFIPHYSPTDGQIWPLLVPGWTLNYEMFFYAIFAICCSLPRNCRLFAITASFVTFVIIGNIVRSNNPAFLTYTDPIQFEFLAGVWLGWLWKRPFFIFPLVGCLSIATGLIWLACVNHFSPMSPRVLEFGVPALLIVAGALACERSGEGFRSKMLLYVGDGSYSIYLWHGLALSVLFKVSAVLHLPVWLTFCLLLAGGIAFGLLSYEFLEKPFLRLFSRYKLTLVGKDTLANAPSPI